MRTFLIAFFVSFCISLVLTPKLRDWAIRKKIVDTPSDRKIHTAPIPRVGGVAILLSMIPPLLGLAFWDNAITLEFRNDLPLLQALIGGSVIIATIGIIDDIFGIRALAKLAGQIAAACVVYASGLHIGAISVPFFSPFILGWMSFPVTLFWVVLVINAINLIDGLDGLAGSVVALAALALFLMGLKEGNLLSCLLLITMLGGLLGFLRYNLNPASVFLGDTGSMFLGFLLALASVHSAQKSYTLFSIVGAFLALALPIFDLAMAVIRRFLSGEPVFQADQHHVHHLLLRRGLTQRQSMKTLFLAAFSLEALALVYIFSGDHLAAASIVLLFVFLGFSVKFLGYKQLISRARSAQSLSMAEDEALKRLQTTQVMVSKILQASDLHGVVESLSEGIPLLGYHRVQLMEANGQVCWSWPNGESPLVHLSDLITSKYTIGSRYFIEIEILKETQIFGPFNTAFTLLWVQAFESWQHSLEAWKMKSFAPPNESNRLLKVD